MRDGERVGYGRLRRVVREGARVSGEVPCDQMVGLRGRQEGGDTVKQVVSKFESGTSSQVRHVDP